MNLQNVNSNEVTLVTNIPDEYKKKFLKSWYIFLQAGVYFNNFYILVALLGWQSPAKNCYHITKNISQDIGLSIEQTYEVVGIYIEIVKLFLQNSFNDFNIKLMDLGFSSDFISKLSLLEHQKDLISNLRRHSVSNFNKLSILKWKIDISLTDR